MNTHIYKKIEVVGTSTDSVEGAIRNAARKAEESLRNLRWFEVQEIRGQVNHGEVQDWQVGLKLAFTLEDEDQTETLSEQAKSDAKSGEVLQKAPDELVKQKEPLK